MYTYFDNKLIGSTFRKEVYETDNMFIKKMKAETEKNITTANTGYARLRVLGLI